MVSATRSQKSPELINLFIRVFDTEAPSLRYTPFLLCVERAGKEMYLRLKESPGANAFLFQLAHPLKTRVLVTQKPPPQ